MISKLFRRKSGFLIRNLTCSGAFRWSVLPLVLLILLTAGCSDSQKDTPPSEQSLRESPPKTPSNSKLPFTSFDTPDIKTEKSGGNNMMFSERRVEVLKRTLRNVRNRSDLDERRALQLQVRLAEESLRSGNLQEALNYTKKPMNILQTSLSENVTPILKKLYRLRLLANLYRSIHDECIERETTEGCFLSHHRWETLPENRFQTMRGHLMGRLSFFPSELSYRWLLNLLYGKVRGTTDGIPVQWRMDWPETTLRSHGLRNRAPELGVDVLGRAGSVAMDDFSGNGRLDLMVSEWGFTDGQLRYFEQSDTGTFVDRTEEAGLLGIKRGLNLTQNDYDNDGDIDLLLLRGAWPQNQPGQQSNVFLENTGSGEFVDRTRELGLHHKTPTQTAAWSDFNRDGWMDVFVGNESPNGEFASFLYSNQNGKGFKNVAEKTDLKINDFVKGASWGDVNGDGWPDLYVSVLGGKNRLYVNQGRKNDRVTFSEQAEDYGVSSPKSSFSTGFFDFNNDGNDDLFVATFQSTPPTPSGRMVLNGMERTSGSNGPVLYENTGTSFRNVSDKLGQERIHFTMGTNIGDLNNDGFPDLLLGTGAPPLSALVPNRLLMNQSGNQFTDDTYDLNAGHFLKGHGAAFGDLDEDGHQEIYQVQGGGYPVDQGRNILLDGDTTGNNWINIDLIGTRSPRSARGSRITLQGRTPAGDTRVIHHRVSTGFSFGSSPLRAEIGLGKVTTADTLTISWTGRPDDPLTIDGPPINETITIHESQGLLP